MVRFLTILSLHFLKIAKKKWLWFYTDRIDRKITNLILPSPLKLKRKDQMHFKLQRMDRKNEIEVKRNVCSPRGILWCMSLLVVMSWSTWMAQKFDWSRKTFMYTIIWIKWCVPRMLRCLFDMKSFLNSLITLGSLA